MYQEEGKVNACVHDLFFQETCAYMHLELNIQACQYLKYCVGMRQRVFASICLYSMASLGAKGQTV